MVKLSIGVLLGLLIAGCAGITIHYYGMMGVDYSQGVLTGPTQSDDIPFSRCKPIETPMPDGTIKTEYQCVVMLKDEFFNLKTDYLDCKQRLNDCQFNCH